VAVAAIVIGAVAVTIATAACRCCLAILQQPRAAEEPGRIEVVVRMPPVLVR
jgi:hypothetical protein